MHCKFTPEIKASIKSKVKKYVGILTLTAVLGGGIYEYVTVSRASAQVETKEQEDTNTGNQQNPAAGGNGEPGNQDNGENLPGDIGTGTGEPEENLPGDTGTGTGEPEENPPEDSGAEGPGAEDPTDTQPEAENPVAAGNSAISSEGILGNALARATQIGIVNTNGGTLNVRKGPGTNYDVITYLAQGTTVTILGQENGWYKVDYGRGQGYVSGEYLKVQDADGVVTDPNADPQYVQQLMNAGFPQSYAIPLASLHAKHPAWVFQPVKTNIEWEKAINEESALRVNMVPINANDSWKSTASGAYNWANNKWTVLDGSSWVGASPAIISYYMDPRNFLNDTYIFQFETLNYESYQNEGDVRKVLEGTFMSGALRDNPNKTYAATFVEAGQKSKVNPSHLAARCRQEQGSGTSPLISGKYSGYEGYYNYFNIGAYGTPTSVLYQNGLSTAKKNGWNSVYASIVGGASHLADKYINLGQNTLYFQKFNVTNSYSGLFRHQYMANVQAAESEGRTMGNAYSNKEQAFVFRIPVYNNMPENACRLPNSGNPNNWLKSLGVSGYNLTPAFNGAKSEYSLIVGESVSSVTVSASPVASTSSVAGTGTVNLKHGSNTVKVTCTAQNGSPKEYVITIVRQGSGQVIPGDVDGDGDISLADLVAVKRHILGYSQLSGEKFTIGDIDGDGEISLMDYVKIKRHILGYEKLN